MGGMPVHFALLLLQAAGRGVCWEDRGLKRPLAQRTSDTDPSSKRPRLSAECRSEAPAPAEQYPFPGPSPQVRPEVSPCADLAPCQRIWQESSSVVFMPYHGVSAIILWTCGIAFL